MKVILHGATNSSNFGDFLFADLFWKELSKHNGEGENIFLEFPRYGIGSFFRKNLGYTYKQSFSDILNADLLIYFSGGYFGQRTDSLIESVTRFIRYMLIGLIFVIKKKPILILGIGGGPIKNKYLRKITCNLMNYSSVVTVRDEQTANYFKDYGVKKDLKITSDTAQVITEDMFPTLDVEVERAIKETFKNKKIIYVHVVATDKTDRLLSEKIAKPLNEFLEKHQDYGVIVGCDQIFLKSIKDLRVSNEIKCESIYFYNYINPWQLCSLLNQVDMIITPKLHVGIVGATLSKSVISFPVHSEKTTRYYNQIGEPGRCFPLAEVTHTKVADMLETYHKSPITLPNEIIDKARENLEVIERYITVDQK